MLIPNWYNCFRKSFMGHRFCKNWLLGTEGAKILVEQQKGPKGGPKSENLLYLSNHDSTRAKNWQMLRTNWYNCFRKSLMGHRFCKNWLLGTEGAKLLLHLLRYSRFSDFGPPQDPFCYLTAIFAPSVPNSQFLQNLWPIELFLNQLYQLVLNICQFLVLIQS